MSKNKQVIIKTLPEGKLTEENYELIESDLPDIEEGEVMVKTISFAIVPIPLCCLISSQRSNIFFLSSFGM